MTSTTTTAEQLLSATNGAGVGRMPPGMVVGSGGNSGPVSSSSVDDEDEMYDEEGDDADSTSRLHSSGANLYGSGSGLSGSAAIKRRKQTKPIRFSSTTDVHNPSAIANTVSEENDRPPTNKAVHPSSRSTSNPQSGVDILDLSRAPTATTTPANSKPVKQQRGNLQPGSAAVLDLCVKSPGHPAATSLKPHDNNSIHQVDVSSRKRALPGNAQPSGRQAAGSDPAVTCSICGKGFAGRSSMQRHVRDCHGINHATGDKVLPHQTNRSKQARPTKPVTTAAATTTATVAVAKSNATIATAASTTTSTTAPNITSSNSSTAANTDSVTAAALQALFLPGAAGGNASATTGTNAAFNPALMFLPNPWANVLPPESLAKLIQAYHLNNNSTNGQNASAASSSPPTNPSSPGLVNGTVVGSKQQASGIEGGRSNPTPPSTSSRSTPQPMSNTSGHVMAEGEQDISADIHASRVAALKAEATEIGKAWDSPSGIVENSPLHLSLPLLGGFEDHMMDQKPADSLLRSTVAARLADRVECDICHKQVCNKYFLKSHKLKIHGIQPTPTSDSGSTTATSTKKTPGTNSQTLESSPTPWNAPTPSTPATTATSSAPLSAPLSASGIQLPMATEAFLNSLPLFRSPARNNGENGGELGSSGAETAGASDDTGGALAGGALSLRTASPAPVNLAVNSSTTPSTSVASSAMMPTDLSVRRTSHPSVSGGLMQFPGAGTNSVVSGTQMSSYLPPNLPPGMAGAIPPPGWRPGSTWRWKETSSISRVTCDICGKELCNKYFLRTHKQNRHGIKDESKPATTSNQKGRSGTNANADQAVSNEWLSSLPSLSKADGENSSGIADSKIETARNRCSECGKRFLSDIVYRRHMGLCHGIPVLIGAEQKNRQRVSNKLKRQSRRRQQQKLLLSDGSSPSRSVGGDLQTDEEAVVFRITSAVNGVSGDNDTAETFDWPQQLCVFLKKQLQQTPSTASSCSSGGGPENGPENAISTSTKLSSGILPTIVTLTLQLEYKKPGRLSAMHPLYAKSGELVNTTTVSDNVAADRHDDQRNAIGEAMSVPDDGMYTFGEMTVDESESHEANNYSQDGLLMSGEGQDSGGADFDSEAGVVAVGMDASDDVAAHQGTVGENNSNNSLVDQVGMADDNSDDEGASNNFAMKESSGEDAETLTAPQSTASPRSISHDWAQDDEVKNDYIV